MLDPTGESAPRPSARCSTGPRRSRACTVGLLDITKPRGDVFLDRLEERLTEPGARPSSASRKPTFTKPAPVDLRHEIAQRCHVVIEALAD